MKFHDFSSFRRSCDASRPLVALVVAAQDYERSKIFDEIFSLLQKKGHFQMIKFSSEEADRAMEALSCGSLFAQDPLVIIDGVDLFKKKQEELVLQYLKNPNTHGCLLLGAREKKGVSLYGEIDAKGVVFDLGFERVKEREKRFVEKLREKCSAAGKTIEMAAVELFFTKTGLDLAIVESESEKLLCFVGEKERIERSDVALICASSDTRNLWEIAEDFVWRQKMPPSLESSLFHPLLSAVRYQLQQGLRMASRESFGEESSFFYKKEEEKRNIALQRGPSFFKKFLLLLFEIDLLSKTLGGSLDSLFSYLHSKMFEALS